jgi:hypothetical protein
MSRREDWDASRVRIPADVERPDKLLAGLTARQLAILGTAGVALWAGYALTRRLVPLPLFGALALPVAAIAVALALGRFEGVAADRWVSFAWRHHRSPHRLVPAPDGVPTVPTFVGADPGPLPSPLRLPLAGVSAQGVIDLGSDGMALACRASAVTFSLRTPAEQEGLVVAFARWLNSLDQATQILVRAEPIDLGPAIAALQIAAPGLPHPALEAAARDHADFLGDLARRRDLLRREVLVVLHQGPGPDAASRLERRAEGAVSALRTAGVTLVPLDGAGAAGALAAALDPARHTHPAAPDGATLYDAAGPVALGAGGVLA